MKNVNRNRELYKVTLAGSVINLILVLLKFAAGVIGASAAMIADAVHSLSDFITDIVVLVFVKIGGKPADKDHHYGHGKFETLATLFIGICLLVVGGVLIANGIEKIIAYIHGETLVVPSWIAFVAAIVSVVLKEVIYQFTTRVGKRLNSNLVIANAWHHRTDALSSIGASIGIGIALVFGEKWAVLDPITAIVVSVFIIVASTKILVDAINELMEKSLSGDVEKRICAIVAEDPELTEMHNLKTRSIGGVYSIEMHVRMPGNTSLYIAHLHTIHLEKRLRLAFGEKTHVNVHIEPTKSCKDYNEE